jgi:hypothetical protein
LAWGCAETSFAHIAVNTNPELTGLEWLDRISEEEYAALFSAGLYPQLKSHLVLGKEHGITKEEAVEIVTQLAFYCGWPKAWSTFPMIQEVYGEEG